MIIPRDLSFIKNSAVYFISNIMAALSPFILLPILSRYLTPAEYADLALLQMMNAVFVIFIGFNASGLTARNVYAILNKARLHRFISSSLTFILLTFIVLLIISFSAKSLLASFLEVDPKFFLVGVVMAFSNVLIGYQLTYFQALRKPFSYLIIQSIRMIFDLGMTLVLVVFLLKGLDGRLYALVLSGLSVSLVSLTFFINLITISKIRFNLEDVKEILDFGVPLLPHMIGGLLITFSDRIIINHFGDKDDLGVYFVAMQLSLAFYIVFTALNLALLPIIYEYCRDMISQFRRKVLQRRLNFGMLIIVISGIAFSFLSPNALILFVDDQYVGALHVLGILILSQFFYGVYLLYSNVIFYFKKTKHISVITVISGMITVLLSIYLTSIYGFVGAGVAFLVGNLIKAGLAYHFSFKIINYTEVS